MSSDTMSNHDKWLAVLVGERVRRFRLDQGLSMTGLAARASIAKSGVYTIEHGKVNASIVSLAKIAGALGIDVLYLFNVGNDPRAELIEAMRTMDQDRLQRILHASEGGSDDPRPRSPGEQRRG